MESMYDSESDMVIITARISNAIVWLKQIFSNSIKDKTECF